MAVIEFEDDAMLNITHIHDTLFESNNTQTCFPQFPRRALLAGGAALSASFFVF